tara:strand:- start:450 stop:1082 length:633 start_codon:yes stop_codon:yes gene_type:complete
VKTTKQNQIKAIQRELKNFERITLQCESLDQRGIASVIEHNVQHHFANQQIFEYSEPTSVRSIDDFTLSVGESTYLIDIKTHDGDREFSMPNLISTERLFKLYQDPNVTFGIAILDYKSTNMNHQKVITKTKFLPIENISWESLSIQNLGHGQIQITNLNKELKTFNGTRKQWLAQFALEMVKYQDKLLMKMNERREKWIKRQGETLLDC